MIQLPSAFIEAVRIINIRLNIYIGTDWVRLSVFGRPFVKRFALCYRTVVCLSCPVCLSCLWRWCVVTKRLDESRCHLVVVLDGDPARPHQKGHSSPPLFGPRLLWTNGWMDQDDTWCGGRRHCVRWVPSSPNGKGHSSPPFSAHVYCSQTVAHLSNCWALVLKTEPYTVGLLELELQ